MHRLQELVRLHRQGSGNREVARLLGMSPNTERVYRRALVAAELLAGSYDALPPLDILKAAVGAEVKSRPPPKQTVSSVVTWTPEVQTLLDRGAGPRAIFDALRLRSDFSGSLSAIKRLCVNLSRARGIRAEDVAIPVVTAPGEIAQVDFGYVGQLYDPLEGKDRRAWIFVMVLGHSRLMFADIVFDQKIETFIDLHIKAFHFLGGVPKVLVPDNLKAAVIRAAFSPSDDLELNRSYRELGQHYGFKIDPTPPRSPKKKGKVERGVKYVKQNFVVTLDTQDIGPVRQRLAVWLRDIANVRVHGATHKVPQEIFDTEEKPTLLTLPKKPYELTTWKKARVYRDSHVIFGKRLYSVPWRLIGEEVWLRATPSTVLIFAHDVRVATHDRRGSEPRSTITGHLPEHRRDYRERQRGYWEERAQLLGDDVATYIKAVFDADDVLLQLRTVQAMVKHLENFPKHRAQAAARRALHFGSFKYPIIKNILKNALDLEPLPAAPAAASAQTTFRFARLPNDIVNPTPKLDITPSSHGESHEYH